MVRPARAGSRRWRPRDVDRAGVRTGCWPTAPSWSLSAAPLAAGTARTSRTCAATRTCAGALAELLELARDRRRHARLALPRAAERLVRWSTPCATRGCDLTFDAYPYLRGCVDPRARGPAGLAAAGGRRPDPWRAVRPGGRRAPARADEIWPRVTLAFVPRAGGPRDCRCSRSPRGSAGPPADAALHLLVTTRTCRSGACSRSRRPTPTSRCARCPAPGALRRVGRHLPRRPPAPARLGHVRAASRPARASSGGLGLAHRGAAPVDHGRRALRPRGPRAARHRAPGGPRARRPVDGGRPRHLRRAAAPRDRACRPSSSTASPRCATAASRARCPAARIR